MSAVGQATPAPAGATALDSEAVRADFPILARSVRGGRLAYLDNAATAQKPRVVLETMDEFYRQRYSNVHRGVHLLSEEATAAYDRAREIARRFLGAARPEEIVFTAGTTAGLNLVARSWGEAHLGAGDEILITAYEHHSNIVPWQIAAHRAGALIRVAPIGADGGLDLAAAAGLIGPRTRIVAVSHASNVLGSVTPLVELARLAHEVDAVMVVDGAQSAPRMPLDVRALRADFFVCSGHKLYGPTGIGILYGRAELLGRMAPWMGGGGMIERVTFEATTYAPPPARFEAGTPPVVEAVGLGAALEYVAGIGMDAIAAHEQDLLRDATERLAAVPGLQIFGTAPGKIGVISFRLGDVHPHDVSTVLDARGVAVRAGHHCAQPLMDRLRVPATVRASFGLYNTREDVDQLVDALGEASRRFKV